MSYQSLQSLYSSYHASVALHQRVLDSATLKTASNAAALVNYIGLQTWRPFTDPEELCR